jgi:lipid-binding SYLF domain-containing protein
MEGHMQTMAISLTAGTTVPGSTGTAQQRASLGFVRLVFFAAAAAMLAALALAPAPAAAQHPELDANARAALGRLKAQIPLAGILEQRAVAVLVFPEVTKAGFMIGGEYGNGVMYRRGRFAGHYNTAGVSYGFQAGAQTFGYVLFLMNESALRALNAAGGFQVGVGPSVVVLDVGTAKSYTSETLTKDAYAFVFSQKGLMAGAGLEGTKITRLSQ